MYQFVPFEKRLGQARYRLQWQSWERQWRVNAGQGRVGLPPAKNRLATVPRKLPGGGRSHGNRWCVTVPPL
jgi:hypothetical protein